MPKKYNRIFSKRSPKARTITQLLHVDDITTLSWEEKRKLDRYARREARKLKNLGYTSRFFTHDDPANEPLPPEDLGISAFSEIMRQKEFLNWKRIEEEVAKNQENYKELDHVMKDDDKWTILRRLAAIDPRLNIDRAYASDTLRQIEDMIEQSNDPNSPNHGKYPDLDSITDEMMINYMELGQVNKDWNEDLTPFQASMEEDAMLVANQGFHGVDKAKAKAKRAVQKNDFSSYEPMWQSPFWFPDEVE